MYPDQYPDGGDRPLSRESVRGIVHQGGTIIGTTNRGNPTAYPVQQPDGTWIEVDRTDELVGLFARRRHRRADHDRRRRLADDRQPACTRPGCASIGVPKTIDNDLDKTTVDVRLRHRGQLRLRVHRPAVLDGDVARPGHRRRGDGPLRRLDRAAAPASASGAHAILIPEIPFDLEPVAATIAQREQRGAKFSIVVVAEGAAPKGGDVSRARQGGRAGREARRHRRQVVAAGLEQLTGKEARTVVLGHLLRGGVADGVRPPARAALRRRRRAGARGGPRRRDGGAQPADRRLRAARARRPAA